MTIYFSNADPDPEDLPAGVGICQDEGTALELVAGSVDNYGDPQCEYLSDYEVLNPWTDALCTVRIFYLFGPCCDLVVNGWSAPYCGTSVHSIAIDGSACS